MFENQPAPLEVSFHTIAHRPIHTSLDRFTGASRCGTALILRDYFWLNTSSFSLMAKLSAKRVPHQSRLLPLSILLLASIHSQAIIHGATSMIRIRMALRLHITWRSPVKDNAQEYGLFTKDYFWRLDVMRGCLNNKVRTTRRWGWERRQYCLSQSWQTPRKSRLTVLEHTGKP